MSTWEERMASRAREREDARVSAARREFLGEVFLPFWPPDDAARMLGSSRSTEISPEIVAARCLGIAYGDPGPRISPEWCRVCWEERSMWRGSAWGVRHKPPGRRGCSHECHANEVGLADAGEAGIPVRRIEP